MVRIFRYLICMVLLNLVTTGFIINHQYLVASETSTPSSPVQARFDGLQPKDNNTFDLQLSFTSPELIAYVKVAIWNVKNGLKVSDDLTFYDVQGSNKFSIKTSQLAGPGEYELHISAISRADHTPFLIGTTDQGNNPTEIVHKFTYTLDTPQIEIQSIVQDGNDLILSMGVTNNERIASFDGWLVQEGSNTVAAGSKFSTSGLGENDRLTLPLNKQNIPSGKYIVVVRALGTDGLPLAQDRSESIVYNRHNPTLLENALQLVQHSPLTILSIIMILIATIMWVTYSVTRGNSTTGMPFTDKQLGSRSQPNKKKGSKSNLPVNPKEPTYLPTSAPKLEPRLPAATRPRGVLNCVRSANGDNLVSRKFVVAPTPFVIGRQEGTLVVNDGKVSRRHACIDYDEQRRSYIITDLGSKNGTRLKGVLLTTHQSLELRPGTQIDIGPNLTFYFEIG